MVRDMALLSKLTGCIRHQDEDLGCGGEGDYHLDWEKTPTGVKFSNFVGFGELAGYGGVTNWDAQAWTRIA